MSAPVDEPLRLAHAIWAGAPHRASAHELGVVLARSPITIISALEHAFRDARTHRRLGLAFLEVPLSRVAWADGLGSERAPALAVLTLVRDGYVRQRALERLAEEPGLLATAFIVARLNDFVRSVRLTAESVLAPRIGLDHVDMLVYVLPLVVQLATWLRGAQSSTRQRILDLFADPTDDRVTKALESGASAEDPDVRRQAFEILAKRHAGTVAILSVLDRAIDDKSPSTRAWAARIACAPSSTPAAIRHVLIGRLAADGAPAVRRLALHAAHRDGDDARVIDALFDGNANVRYDARAIVKKRRIAVRQRERALSVLAEPQAEIRRVVGALAALSEVGLLADVPLITGFARDPRRVVAAEAKRTLALLRV
jgi:HEAT repeat protein